MQLRRFFSLATYTAILCSGGISGAAVPVYEGIVTGVDGQVFLARPGTDHPMVLQPYSILSVGDVLEAQPRSQLKALFHEHLLVAISPDSRVEVTGVPNSRDSQHKLVLRVVRGTARIVTDDQDQAARNVEVHTPTAVIVLNQAGAFLVHVDHRSGEATGTNSATLVSNLGTSGQVQVRSHGETVRIGTGQSSTVLGGRPPSAPYLLKVATQAELNRLLQSTLVREGRRPESPRQTLLVNGGTEPFTVTVRPGPTAARSAPPLVPVTPPAVISGAVTVGQTGVAVGITPVTPQPSTPTPIPAPLPAPTPMPAAPPPVPAPTPAAPPPAPTLPAPAPSPVVIPPLPLPPVPTVPALPRPTIPRVDIDDDDRGGRNRGRR